MTETQAAKSVRNAIEAWQFGGDHARILWRRIDDPIHATERCRDIIFKVHLSHLADNIMAHVEDEESDTEILTAAEKITKAVEGNLLSGAYFENLGNPFKRATAEVKLKASAEFVRRMRRVINGEEANGA